MHVYWKECFFKYPNAIKFDENKTRRPNPAECVESGQVNRVEYKRQKNVTRQTQTEK